LCLLLYHRAVISYANVLSNEHIHSTEKQREVFDIHVEGRERRKIDAKFFQSIIKSDEVTLIIN
jgi:hypothetical protein